MKLITYFFTIPFSPKSEWGKAMNEINNSRSIKEDAILIFMLMTGVLILKSYLMDVYLNENYFSFESVFMQYFYLIITTLLITIGVRLFGGKYGLANIESSKLFLIIVLGIGFWKLISGLVLLYFITDFYYYGFFTRELILFLIAIVGSTYVVYGLIQSSETNFESKLLSKNVPLIFSIAGIMIGVGLLYDFVISRIIYSLFYMF